MLVNEVERFINLVKVQGCNGYYLNGFKMNYDRQEFIKMGLNNYMKIFFILNNNEFKQFCVLQEEFFLFLFLIFIINVRIIFNNYIGIEIVIQFYEYRKEICDEFKERVCLREQRFKCF